MTRAEPHGHTRPSRQSMGRGPLALSQRSMGRGAIACALQHRSPSEAPPTPLAPLASDPPGGALTRAWHANPSPSPHPHQVEPDIFNIVDPGTNVQCT